AVVAEAGLTLLGADMLDVVVWDDQLTHGKVRAVAGDGLPVGSVRPLTEPWRDWLLGTDPYAGPPQREGLEPGDPLRLPHIHTVIRLPLFTTRGRTSFHAGWRRELDAEEQVEATALLATLSRLTMLTERAQRIREQDAMFDALPTALLVT